MEYIHNQQMWHLDLKPGNILLDKNGQPLLIDFGASKQLGKQNGESTSIAMSYTPGYAPPEQIDQAFDRIGAWTDLYALGATLYNMLTGNVPPSVSEIQEDADEAFCFPVNVSEKFRRLIRWLMKPNRRQRMQSVADVRAFLWQEENTLTVAREHADENALPMGGDETIFSETQSIQSAKAVLRSNFLSAETNVEIDDAVYYDEKGYFEKNKWLMFATAVIVFLVVVLLSQFESKGGRDNLGLESIDTAIVADHWVENFQATCSRGVCTYTGEIDDDSLPHGKGKATFANGYYNGWFKHGRMEGDGVYFRYDNGDEFFGSMHNDNFVKGRYVVKTGNYFVGTFKNGQTETGTWYDKNGKAL